MEAKHHHGLYVGGAGEDITAGMKLMFGENDGKVYIDTTGEHVAIAECDFKKGTTVWISQGVAMQPKTIPVWGVKSDGQ